MPTHEENARKSLPCTYEGRRVPPPEGHDPRKAWFECDHPTEGGRIVCKCQVCKFCPFHEPDRPSS